MFESVRVPRLLINLIKTFNLKGKVFLCKRGEIVKSKKRNSANLYPTPVYQKQRL